MKEELTKKKSLHAPAGEQEVVVIRRRKPVDQGEPMSAAAKMVIAMIVVAALLMVFNQVQIRQVAALSSIGGTDTPTGKDLSSIDITQLKSTGQTVAAVFPSEKWASSDDVFASMFPTGTPEYGDALGVSFDDPVGSLTTLSKMYPSLKNEVQQKDPEAWARWMNLASKPVGISCEYCCGVGPIGIDSKGNSACGCQHNPALLSVGLYLTAYTNYSDGQILHEVMRWKTLFFPQDMVALGTSVIGGDTSALQDLPGMVGGC